MKSADLESMGIDQLWSLREEIASELSRKMLAEKAQLERRLRQLAASPEEAATNKASARRPYPRVSPKYRNPAEPSETWTGRGKTPRWLTAQLKSGKKLDDFRIQRSNNRTGRSGRHIV
ncbi:H-NS family nucleoid-associated regulatory protein [Bradyrhizobium sp.]|uniref:H-NS histone family protein n=1 Tax=Bradyrhizobium sp. TaxID=376 RepID=UPI003C5D287A